MKELIEILEKNKTIIAAKNAKYNELNDSEIKIVPEILQNFKSGNKREFEKININKLFSIEDLRKIYESGDTPVKKDFLKLYQKNIEAFMFMPLSEKQKEIFDMFISRTEKFFVDVYKQIEINNKKLQSYDSILNKINNFECSDEFIEELIELINNQRISYEEKFKLLLELQKYITKANEYKIETSEQVEELEEELHENGILLTDDELNSLFDKYNFNYQLIQEKDRALLRKYGNIGNMEEILEELMPYNVQVISNKFTEILLYSSKEIVVQVKEVIKKEIDESLPKSDQYEAFCEYFGYCFTTHGIFLKKFRTIEARGKGGTGRESGNGILRANDNFNENIKYLKNNGIDIKKVLKSCPSILIISPSRMRQQFKVFALYGITSEKLSGALSALNSPEPLDSIDRFIELDCYDYLLQNLTRTYTKCEDMLFYKLKYHRLHSKTNEEYENKVYSSKPPKEYRLKYGLSDRETKANRKSIEEKRKIVGQMPYFYELEQNPLRQEKFSEVIKTLDLVVNTNENMGPYNFALRDQFIRVLDENFKIDELRYSFNGTIVSRLKVLRIYDTLIRNKVAGTYCGIMYAITYKSIFTGEEMQNIKNCITTKILFPDLKGIRR